MLQAAEQAFPCSSRRTTCQTRGYPLGEAAAWGGREAQQEQALQQKLLTVEQAYPEGLKPVEKTHATAVHKGPQTLGRARTGAGNKHEDEKR